MISPRVKYLCKDDISLIENYAEAVSDTEQKWECHHRKETMLHKSMRELQEMGMYWHVPASDLIFLRKGEHDKLHTENKRFTGRHHTEEAKRKIGEHSKGNAYAKRGDIWKHKAEILDLHKQGHSRRELARMFGCSRTVIQNIVLSEK